MLSNNLLSFFWRSAPTITGQMREWMYVEDKFRRTNLEFMCRVLAEGLDIYSNNCPTTVNFTNGQLIKLQNLCEQTLRAMRDHKFEDQAIAAMRQAPVIMGAIANYLDLRMALTRRGVVELKLMRDKNALILGAMKDFVGGLQDVLHSAEPKPEPVSAKIVEFRRPAAARLRR